MIRITLFSMMLLAGITACNQKGSSDTKQTSNTKIQPGDVSISELSTNTKDGSFPLVHFAKDKRIEDKINTFLQVEQLQHLPGIFKKNPFEEVSSGEDNPFGVSDFDSWEQHKTYPSIVSFTIEGTNTGSYTESFETQCNFDLRTGNPILLANLFTTDGLTQVAQMVNKRVNKTIQDQIENLTTRSSQSTPENDTGYLSDEITMYQTCLDGTKESDASDLSYYFSKDSIIFVRGRCSSHAEIVMDELWDFHIGIPLSSIKQYLSPYGQSLLNNDNTNLNSDSPEGKLYKGFINGKYPISAMINNIESDESLTMFYWYDKTKIPIEISGTFKNQHFSLIESDDSGADSKEIAKIEADWVDHKKITGTWTNSKTHEVLKLELVAE